MTRPRLQRRRAFTVAELIGVMVIVSALSLSAAPAMQWLSRSRQKGLETEVERLLREARALAIASGRPTGVQFLDDNSTLALVWIDDDGSPPTGAPGPTGQPTAPIVIATQFPGAAIESIVVHGSSETAIWFGYAGEPEVRDEDGAFRLKFTDDAAITVTGAGIITVRRLTGLVE